MGDVVPHLKRETLDIQIFAVSLFTRYFANNKDSLFANKIFYVFIPNRLTA